MEKVESEPDARWRHFTVLQPSARRNEAICAGLGFRFLRGKEGRKEDVRDEEMELEQNKKKKRSE